MTTQAPTELEGAKSLDTELLDGAAAPAPLPPDDEHEASLARQTVSGLAWTMSMGWGARVVQILGTLLLTYFVDPQEMGEVTTAAVLVMSADRFSGMGVSNFILTRKNPAREVVWHVSAGLAATGALAVVLLALFAHPLGRFLNVPHIMAYLPGLAIATFLTRMGVVPERLLQGRLRFRDVSVARAWSDVSYAVGATVLGFLGAGGMSVVGGNLLRSVVYVSLMSRRVSPAYWLKPARFSRDTTRSIFAFGAPLTVAHVCSVAARYWDNLMMSWMFGAATTGTYNLAYNMADIPATQIGENISDVLTPSLVQLERERRKVALVRWLRILSLVVFPAAVGLGVVGPTLVRTALPPKWAGVAPMLVILSCIGVLRPVGWAIGSYLIACGRARAVMTVMLINVAALLGAMVLLGRPFGPLGACFGVGVGFCAYAIAFASVLVRTEGVSLLSLVEAMTPPLYACAVMVLGVLGTRTLLAWSGVWIRGGNLVVEVLVGALTYAGVCLLVARPVVRDAAFLLRDTWSRRGSVAAVA